MKFMIILVNTPQTPCIVTIIKLCIVGGGLLDYAISVGTQQSQPSSSSASAPQSENQIP
jgi:hypothetical protein